MSSDLWGVIKEGHAHHTEVLLSIAKELQNTRDRLLGNFFPKKKKNPYIISHNKQGSLSNMFPLLL